MRKILLFVGVFIFSITQISAQQKWDRPMKLKSCFIGIRADQFTAATFIEMEFCNPNDREIEGLYRFELKSGQVITAFQLDLNGKYRDGSIEEKWKATNAYNTIVGNRIDPALLSMDYSGHYNLRIYPVPAKGCRKVTMTIQQLLTAEKNQLQYFLPLNNNDTVQYFRLNIHVNGNNNNPLTKHGLIADKYFVNAEGGYKFNWNAENVLLKSPVAFSMPLPAESQVCIKTNNDQTFFALRFRPSFPKEEQIRPKLLTVFWDASPSLTKRDITKEINFLKQFISWHNISQLTIIPFNYRLLDTAMFYTENGFNSRWQQYLHNITYDGSTQLGVIDLSNTSSDITLIFTDGNNTYGKSRPKTSNAIVSCIHSSRTANLNALQEIVGASGGKVIDLNKTSISSAIAASSNAENWLLNVSSASGKTIIEQAMPLKQAEVLFINGTMPQRTDTLYFQYGSNGHITNTEKIIVHSNVECPASSIDRINMLNNYEDIIRSYSWSNMVDFGLKEKVVTPNTAYIVLERIEDYVRYNISPPKELEAECEKINYVKRDTRFERRKMEQASEFDILRNVVNIYNQRISKWDANEKLIHLDKSDYENQVANRAEVNIPSNSTSNMPSTNELSGKVAGLDIRSQALEEVVVVGYGTMKRSNLTSSVTQIRSQDLFSSATSVEQALQGRVAGLQVTGTSGMPGNVANIRIRGMSSFNNNQPLYVIDGMPVSGNINDLVNVNDIDFITVLKDHSAAAIYGSRASAGAIIINTKKGRNYFNRYNSKPYRLRDMEDVEYLQEIKNALKSEKLSAYEKLKEEYGGEAGFYFDVAQHFFEIGFKEQAYNVLMNAAEAANGSQQVLVAIAYILEGWHRYTEAISVYEELSKDNPNNLVFQSDLAWAHYQSGNYQRAIDILFGAIKMSTAELEQSNLYLKSMMMNDMNAIISLHKNNLDISGIPAVLIRPMPVDMRIVIDCNKSNMSNISVKEPGNYICNYSNPVTKNGGTIQQEYYWYSSKPFEYQVKKAPEGRYRISVNFYDYYSYNGKIPSVIRIRKFKNFGKENQSIEVENVMMDNQHGEIEIGEIKWNEK